ncbi:transposase [Pseudogracilibacillus sp. SO30301A]
MFITSVNALYKSNYESLKEMQKDTFYRVKNNERLPWRSLLLNVSKRFQELVNPEKEVKQNSAFIFDDTIDARTGKKIENISYVHDHVAGRKGRSTLGFKNLTMGLFDGTSFTPLDFSLHSEKMHKRKYRKKQYKKERDSKTNGAKRIKECNVDKIINSFACLKGL